MKVMKAMKAQKAVKTSKGKREEANKLPVLVKQPLQWCLHPRCCFREHTRGIAKGYAERDGSGYCCKLCEANLLLFPEARAGRHGRYCERNSAAYYEPMPEKKKHLRKRQLQKKQKAEPKKKAAEAMKTVKAAKTKK